MYRFARATSLLWSNQSSVSRAAQYARHYSGSSNRSIFCLPNVTRGQNHMLLRAFASHPLPVPEIGESIREGIVAEWPVKDGEGVKEDQVLVQLETDKIVFDVRAEKAGVFIERTANEGDVVAVGEQLALIDYDATVPASSESQSQSEPVIEEPPVTDATPIVEPIQPPPEKPQQPAKKPGHLVFPLKLIHREI